MKYAVYNETAMVNGIYDNDFMDWFDIREEAEAAAQELANETRKTAYVAEVQDGDFGDYAEEFDPE